MLDEIKQQATALANLAAAERHTGQLDRIRGEASALVLLVGLAQAREPHKDTLDYLGEARIGIKRAWVDPDPEGAQVNTQLATACALVAQTERLDMLIERLDTLIVPLKGGEKALQTFSYTQEN